ncbi:hypothetical protein MMC29_006052 [Sticta canariensis]|nr:hypothetical protein [Sticta canariensis]
MADRKTKTGFASPPHEVSFALGLARFEYDSSKEEGGHRVAMRGFLTIQENNRALTSYELTLSLLGQAKVAALRPIIKTWVFYGQTKDWTLAHSNPTRAPPRDIAPWTEPRLLSTVLDMGNYEQKPVPGSGTKLVTIWLYITPEAPV